MNGLEIDKDTFTELDDKGQHLVLYDLIRARHVPETCGGLKRVWTHIKIQWWWLALMSSGLATLAFFIVRSALT